MKTYKIPKEESAYVCLPITKNGGAVDTSALTGISMKLKSSYGTETTLTVEALGYSGVVAKVENVACGSYTLKATGTDTASAILTAECMLEVVHYDSQANVVAGVYKTLPCYILTNEKEGVGQKGLEARMASLESSMTNVTALASAQVPSRLSTLETGLTAANTAIATKATVVDLADVISCACTDAQNTGICDHCKLPTLKATFIYSVDSNTVLIPHMRTIKVTGKRGYADGYYLAFCVYHNTQSDPKALLYLLFSVATKKLIGQYHTDLNEEVPEWVLYAFHEVNGIGAGGYIVDINDDGVATDLLGRKWQMQKWQETVLDPVITIEDVTGNTISGATGAIKRISIDYDRASEKKYKIELVGAGNSSVTVTEMAYTEPFTFRGDGKYKITAWSKTNGKESVRITKEFTVTKLEITANRVYEKPAVGLSYNDIAVAGTATGTYISPVLSISQNTTYYYTDGTSSTQLKTLSVGTGVSASYSVVEGSTPSARVTKHTDFVSNGKIACTAATTYSEETVINVKVIVTANGKNSEAATCPVKQSGKTKQVYYGSSDVWGTDAPTTSDGIMAGTVLTSGTVKDLTSGAALVWVAVPTGKTLTIYSENDQKDVKGEWSQISATVDGQSYLLYYVKASISDKFTISFS